MVFDDTTLARIERIKQHAMRHPTTPDQLFAPDHALNEAQSLRIEPGYLAFFTVQRFPDEKYYGQLSVSAIGQFQPDATMAQMETLAQHFGLGNRANWSLVVDPRRSGLRAFNVFAIVQIT